MIFKHCPNCGKEVFVNLRYCNDFKCKFPFYKFKEGNVAAIKMSFYTLRFQAYKEPVYPLGWAELSDSYIKIECSVIDTESGHTLWSGYAWETAVIELDKKTPVILKCKSPSACKVLDIEAEIEPDKLYQIKPGEMIKPSFWRMALLGERYKATNILQETKKFY